MAAAYVYHLLPLTNLFPYAPHHTQVNSVSHETSSKPNSRFMRDFLPNSGTKFPKRARTRHLIIFQKSFAKSPKQAFCARLPQQLTLEVYKTSVSYETSSKSHASSLQNERFVRHFLQKSSVKVFQTSISYETSCKSQTGSPIGAHQAALPSSFAVPRPPNNTRSRANPNVTATFTDNYPPDPQS